MFASLSGDCDFEGGLCSWSNDRTGDDFDWILGQGGTPSSNTGPSVDHTLGSSQGKVDLELLLVHVRRSTKYYVFDCTLREGSLCMVLDQ